MRPISSGCSWVCTNQPGRTRAPSLALPVWMTGSMAVSSTGRCSTSGSLPPAASSRRKCDLPEPLEPRTATRSPYQTSRSNGFIRPVSSRLLADHGALAGAAALEPHLHLLLARLLGRRAGLLELAQPGLRRAVLRGHAVVVLRLDPVAEHQRLELRVLLVPAAAQLLEAQEPVLARLVVRREAARVGPHQVAGRTELDGDHAGRGVVEQLAVVADEQDRLVGLLDPPLEPDLAGHVEEVVRLVEQQHLVRPGQQVLQHQPLLLAAGERAQLAVLGAVVGHAEALDGADVPGDLELVAARVGVLGQRVGVGELGLLVVGLHQRPLAPVDLGRGGADPGRAHREQQVGDGRLGAEPGADHLPHHPEPAGAGDRAGVRRELAGDDLAAAWSCRRRWRRPARPWRPRPPGTTRRRAAPGRRAARSALRRRPRVPRASIVRDATRGPHPVCGLLRAQAAADQVGR